jgi:thiol-disulfide isomerase/thioredoxin
MFRVALLILAIFFFTGCEEKKEQPVVIKKIDNTKFKFQNIDGVDFNITKKGGGFVANGLEKPIFMIFFSTWCKACLGEIPHLVDIQKKHGKNLQIISFVLDTDDTGILKRLRTKYKINYPISHTINENRRLLKQITTKRSIPFMIMYNKDGKYITHYEGAVAQEMIEMDIRNNFE